MQKQNKQSNSVGQRLEYVRKEILGYNSQRLMAEYFDVYKATITRYENDNRSFPLKLFIKLYSEFNINPNWIQFGYGLMFCDPKLSSATISTETMGKRLVFVRREIAGISSQKKFADILSISITSLNLYEQDKGDMPTKVFIKLNELYDISLNWLLFGKEPILLDN